MEIVDAANRWFAVGVATADLRNTADKFSNCNSLCIGANSGTLYSNGTKQQLNLQINTGDIITLRRKSGEVEWMSDEKVICSVAIPSRFIEEPIFPVLWIRSYNDDRAISKLRFVE